MNHYYYHCTLNSFCFMLFSDCLIKFKVETVGLNEEQKKYVYDMSITQATTFVESHNYSKVKATGVRALLEFLETIYRVSRQALNVGSLIISLNCKTLKSLDQLWNDRLSGHLNKVAERYLVTDEMKKKLNLRTINLKTTIEEENYLNCRKVLMECSGEYQCLFFLYCNIMEEQVYVYRFDLGPWVPRHLYCIRGLAKQTSGDSRMIDSIGNNSHKLLIQGFLVIGNRYTV